VAEVEKCWFAIHTYSGYEERVKKNLEQRIKSMDSGDEIFQVLIPTEEEIEIKRWAKTHHCQKICPVISLLK